MPGRSLAQNIKANRSEWSHWNNLLLNYVGKPDSPGYKAIIAKQHDLNQAWHEMLHHPEGFDPATHTPDKPYDIVMVGGGPGGMQAAIAGRTDGLDVRVIDANPETGGQSRWSSRLENVGTMGPEGARGEQVAGNMRDTADRLGVEMTTGTRVTGITMDPETGVKTLTLSDGSTVQARSVVLAGGVDARHLGFPGEESDKVVYSGNFHDVAEKAGSHGALIIGGSNGAAQSALGVVEDGNQDVHILSRSPIDKGMSDYQVSAVHDSEAVTIHEGDNIASFDPETNTVTTKNGETIPNIGAIGVFAGGPPATSWLPASIARDSSGHLTVDEEGQTTMPGVFAVGDIRAGAVPRVTAAVGDGMSVEAHINNNYLNESAPGRVVANALAGKQTMQKAFKGPKKGKCAYCDDFKAWNDAAYDVDIKRPGLFDYFEPEVTSKKFFPTSTKADMFKGGAGSGNHGHLGRPGERGGSSAGAGMRGDIGGHGGVVAQMPHTEQHKHIGDHIKALDRKLEQLSNKTAHGPKINGAIKKLHDAVAMKAIQHQNHAYAHMHGEDHTHEHEHANLHKLGGALDKSTTPLHRLADFERDHPNAKVARNIAQKVLPIAVDVAAAGIPVAEIASTALDAWMSLVHEPAMGYAESMSEYHHLQADKFFPSATKADFLAKGGAGSGDFGHAGRPGEVGGSGEGGGEDKPSDHVPSKNDAYKETLDENGTAHPKSMEDALFALHAGVKVDFEQPRQVGTLLHKLAEEARNAKAAGEDAPHIDLCGVSVAGTNAFCAGNLGIPRIKMPQMTSTNPRPGSQADGLPRKADGEVDASGLYKQWLADKGYSISNETEDASMLHATQLEIDGNKVGKMMEGWDPAKAHPIFVSNDNYILDGHHSWAAQAGLEFDTGKTINVPVARVNANIFELLDTAWTFTQEVGIPNAGFGKIHNFWPTLAKIDFFKGGAGSGNFGHAGRPGAVGGSAEGGSAQHYLTGTRSRGAVKPNPNMSEEELLARIRGTYGQVEDKPKTQTPVERLNAMRVHDEEGNPVFNGDASVFKTPSGSVVNFEHGGNGVLHDSSDDLTVEQQLRVLDAADKLNATFGQPKSINVVSAETMRNMAGLMPWSTAPFGMSQLGGVSASNGQDMPMILNADTLDPNNEDFKNSAERGAFMPTALITDPMVYTVTHETGHMVDTPETLNRDKYGNVDSQDPFTISRPTAQQDALDKIRAGSKYGQGAFTGPGSPRRGVLNNDPEAFAEAFAEYTLTNGQTGDKLARALGSSAGWGRTMLRAHWSSK